jgi:peptidase E
MPTPTILAMGGGGFTMEPDNPLLDELVIELAGVREPNVLFLPTASGDADAQSIAFQSAFGDRECNPRVLSLFRLGARGPLDLRELILGQHVIYVGGGSMRNLLAVWRVHNLDTILREAWMQGVVLAGISAGGMCWFAGGVTTSMGEPEPTPGLGFLPGSLTVHADGEPARLPVYERAVAEGVLPDGWAADDGVGLVFRGTRLQRVVSSRARARAWRVEHTPDGVRRTPVLPVYLGLDRRDDAPPPADPAVRELRRARYGSALRD